MPHGPASRRDLLKAGLAAGLVLPAAALLGPTGPRRAVAGGVQSPLNAFLIGRARQVQATMTATQYAYQYVWDTQTGVYRTDCSGFVSICLQEAALPWERMIPRETSEPVPRAFKYYEWFATPDLPSVSGGMWQRVTAITDVLPGDILAWGSFPIREGTDTGHVMIVDEAPVPVIPLPTGADTPPPGTAAVWSVRVIDSSDVVHFLDGRPADPRCEPATIGGTTYQHTGIGFGSIRLAFDAGGNQLGHQMGPGDPWHGPASTPSSPFAFGRALGYAEGHPFAARNQAGGW